MTRREDGPSRELRPWTPFSIEAEQGLLGAILVNNHALALVDNIISAQHFHEPLHGDIFQICSQLIGAGKVADPTTLRTFLPAGVKIAENMTVGQYLARLAAEATTIINARDYAEAIRDLHSRRVMRDVGHDLVADAPADTLELAAKSIEVLDTIISEHAQTQNRVMSLRETAVMAVEAAAKAFQSDGALQGLSSGLKDLDAKTNGLHPGELIVLAGRPGMGKTAVALSIARSLGYAGHAGIIFSLEMEGVPLMHRMMADDMYDHRPLHYTKILSGRFDEEFFAEITAAGERLAALPIMIDQQAALTVSQISARTRRAVKSRKVKWIIIDHLHLMKKSGNFRGNAVLEIGEITSTLKALAKELGVVVILLSQLSRQVEGREDKRPTLSDLRFSGDIEQDADVVAMLYREAYYVQRQEPDARPDSEEHASWRIRMDRCFNKLDVIIEKQRQGSTGTIRVHCNIACNAVRDLADSTYSDVR